MIIRSQCFTCFSILNQPCEANVAVLRAPKVVIISSRTVSGMFQMALKCLTVNLPSSTFITFGTILSYMCSKANVMNVDGSVFT